MKDFMHEDVSGTAIGYPVTAPILGARYTLILPAIMPAPANINAPFDAVFPADQRPQKLANFQYRDWGKQALDSLLVLLALPFAIPLISLCVAALWFESGLPFYRQDRLGRDGRKFSILKLRTMVRDAEQQLESCLAADPELRREWNATQKLKNDPRITRIGSILRKTSLDELPQIWNVLKGEMSLVGPRPMMPEQLSLYGDARPYFAMRPGITGIWQVSARNEKDFSHRADVDADYFQTVSMGRDLVLLLKTVGVVLQRTGY